MLNWIVIVTIYVLTAVAIYHQQVIYLAPPPADRPEHMPQNFERAIVVTLNVMMAMLFWGMLRKYTGPGPAASLLPHAETKTGDPPSESQL